ncbi:hypothetical protein IQ238_08555 [Pleurocapsales cyanobacterium LEGE 06147]|nr:hypothetical protein [Pleurocapsales cyanobacterium LEGE 06147]
MSIYVGNLSYEVDREDLNEVFSEYGTVKRVHVPTDRDTGRVRGFAFVLIDYCVHVNSCLILAFSDRGIVKT